MKKISQLRAFLTIALLACHFLAVAQTLSCGYENIILSQVIPNDTGYFTRLNQYGLALSLGQITLYNDPFSPNWTRHVPVAVHVYYNDANSPDNIAICQIKDAILALNEDFRRMPGTTGFGDGVDSRINFHLIGVTRNEVPFGVLNFSSNLGLSTLAHEALIKRIIHPGGVPNPIYDWHKVLNIYVVPKLTYEGSTTGFAFTPNAIAGPNMDDYRDGVVIVNQVFGRIGTVLTHGSSLFSLSKITTHEVGHWAGLMHTYTRPNPCVVEVEPGQYGPNGCFQDNCHIGGDQVCDTPPARWWQCSGVPQTDCPVTWPNSCSTDLDGGGSQYLPSDQLDPFDNYMHYGNNNCMNAFTAGQRDRMDAFLYDNNYRITNWDYCFVDGSKNSPFVQSSRSFLASRLQYNPTTDFFQYSGANNNYNYTGNVDHVMPFN